MISNPSDRKFLKIAGELYNPSYNADSTLSNIVVDTDYILDRNLNQKQGTINSDVNSKLNNLINLRKFTLSADVSWPQNEDTFTISAKIYRKSADNNDNLYDSIGDNLVIWYKFIDDSGEYLQQDENILVYNDIPYTATNNEECWKTGVSISTIQNKLGNSPAKAIEILLKSWDGVLFDSKRVNLNQTKAAEASETYTKAEVNTMLQNVSGSGLSYELANQQDIQNVFRMQYVSEAQQSQEDPGQSSQAGQSGQTSHDSNP